jgi:hypothetical protein
LTTLGHSSSGVPYRIPYRIWFETSHQEVETKIIFPLFRLWGKTTKATGKAQFLVIFCMYSFSLGHDSSYILPIIYKPATRLKCPGRCIRKKPGCGRPILPSASSEALGQVPCHWPGMRTPSRLGYGGPFVASKYCESTMHPVYHAKITVSTKNFPRSEGRKCGVKGLDQWHGLMAWSRIFGRYEWPL